MASETFVSSRPAVPFMLCSRVLSASYRLARPGLTWAMASALFRPPAPALNVSLPAMLAMALSWASRSRAGSVSGLNLSEAMARSRAVS